MNIWHNIKSYLGETRYFIGFIEKGDLLLPVKERFKKIKWLDEGCYNEGWFADPFIYKETADTILLFVEEWQYKYKKGRLCCLEILKSQDTYKLNRKYTMLDIETHVSYPIFIKEGKDTYVYPENWQSGSLKIYQYDESKHILINPVTIINDPLVDTSIIKIKGTYYAFGTPVNSGTLDDTKLVNVYTSSTLLGKWSLIQTIKNKRREERGAGQILENGGKFIRPVQNCQNRYGEDIAFYRLELDENRIKEVCISRIEPDTYSRNGLGLHTFNQNGNLCVLDGKEYRRRVIARMLKTLV